MKVSKKSLVVSFAVSALLSIVLTTSAYSQSLKLNFPESQTLYALSVSYLDGPINIPEDCKFWTPSFHFRSEKSVMAINDGQSGSFGLCYRIGAGGLEQKIWEYKQLLEGERFRTGNYTTKRSVRVTVEALLTYHYPVANYVDAYVRSGIGFVPTYKQIEKEGAYAAKDCLCYGGMIGIQCMLKGKFGVFAEAGVASQLVSAGIVWGSSSVTSVLSKVFSSMF